MASRQSCSGECGGTRSHSASASSSSTRTTHGEIHHGQHPSPSLSSWPHAECSCDFGGASLLLHTTELHSRQLSRCRRLASELSLSCLLVTQYDLHISNVPPSWQASTVMCSTVIEHHSGALIASQIEQCACAFLHLLQPHQTRAVPHLVLTQAPARMVPSLACNGPSLACVDTCPTVKFVCCRRWLASVLVLL